MRRFGFALAASVAILTGMSGPGSASTSTAAALPAPFTQVIFFDAAGDEVTYSAPGTYSAFGATGSAALSPFPTVSASAGNSSLGQSYLQYYFSANGAPNTMVPFELHFSVSTSANGSSSLAQTGITIWNYAEGWSSSVSTGEACSATGQAIKYCEDPTFPVSISNGTYYGSIESDTKYAIGIVALAEPDNANPSASASASVDPTITLLNPNYSLALSPGIGNGIASVPEPATWAMLILGVAMVGAAFRRRSAGTAVAA